VANPILYTYNYANVSDVPVLLVFEMPDELR
jgi:hypothetical protein